MLFNLLRKFLRESESSQRPLYVPKVKNEHEFLSTGKTEKLRASHKRRKPNALGNTKQSGESRSKPYDKRKKSVAAPAAERVSLPWHDITSMLGQESVAKLDHSIQQLSKICKSNPLAAPEIATVLEQLEQARRTALITMQFVQSRTSAEHETGYVSLRQVVMEVLHQRAAWLKARDIKISVGPLDAKLIANITALFLLVDELVTWAAKLAPGVVIAINPSKLNRTGIQLLVFAKFGDRHTVEAEWTNVGWYLWHKLAAAVGGSAELNVMDDALCVSVTFVPILEKDLIGAPDKSSKQSALSTLPEMRVVPSLQKANTPAISATSMAVIFSGVESADHTNARELSHDKDVAEIVQGCHVFLIVSDLKIRDIAARAISGLGLHIKTISSVQEALLAASKSQIPHAVIFHSKINTGEILQLRSDWADTRKTAYIEICDADDSTATDSELANFHFTSIGTMSTAHVITNAVPDSLVPALVFELCKVL